MWPPGPAHSTGSSHLLPVKGSLDPHLHQHLCAPRNSGNPGELDSPLRRTCLEENVTLAKTCQELEQQNQKAAFDETTTFSRKTCHF